MTDPRDPLDDAFDGWLNDRLDTVLGVQAGAPAPANARYLTAKRRRLATPLRIGLASGAAVLAIGGGAAYATGLVPGTAVSQSAQSCPTGPNDAHGDCVAAAAHSNSGHEAGGTGGNHSSGQSNNDSHGDAVSNAAHTCPTSPGDAHGDCVSAIASGGRSTTHTEETTSHTGSANHGQSISGVAQSGPHGPGQGSTITGAVTSGLPH